MKTQTNWTVRLRWTIRLLKRFVAKKAALTPEERQKLSQLARLTARLARLLILILRAWLLIRELFRVILRSFQSSGKS